MAYAGSVSFASSWFPAADDSNDPVGANAPTSLLCAVLRGVTAIESLMRDGTGGHLVPLPVISCEEDALR